MRELRLRALFVLTMAWGASIFWLAPYPPMIDLPQHAGQVALLRDLLLGQSPWVGTMQVNLFTPYLIGYGMAVPISLVVPVSIALKVLLSTFYVGFVFMCVMLRRHFGSDARLDWLFLPGFFGFAYAWGLFTFLVAAPAGLCFIWVADRYAQQRTFGRAVTVIVLGLGVLASHALTFLFGWSVGVLLLVRRMPALRCWLYAAWPYAVLALTCFLLFSVGRRVEEGLTTALGWQFSFDFGLLRLPKALTFAVGYQFNLPFIGAALVLLCVPWMLGLRIDLKRSAAWVPFLVVVVVMAFVPSSGFQTALLYQRFALFLLPAYAWMFTTSRASIGEPRPLHRWGQKLAMPLLMVGCWAVLGVHSVVAWRFGQEAADFDAMLAAVQPGQRALGLVYERRSEATGNPYTYQHYVVWYQAERQGLVDFNFAWFPPQIVRFRPGQLPSVGPRFDLTRRKFDWAEHRGRDYRYFFVRSAGQVPSNLFDGADCAPTTLSTRGSWTVFERGNCR